VYFASSTCILFDDVVPNSDYTGLNDWLAAKSNLKNCAAEGRAVKIKGTVPEFAERYRQNRESPGVPVYIPNQHLATQKTVI
jgi:hypothetical protein